MPNIYEMISRSIAPSIYGSSDIKKAIACMLFGGSRKRYKRHQARREWEEVKLKRPLWLHLAREQPCLDLRPRFIPAYFSEFRST